MKIIGLTGGIGSGKSTVSEYLATRGYDIVDADKIARELTSGKTKLVEKLVNAFGNKILDEKGNLNRKKLADMAFGNIDNEKILNSITHNEISAEMNRQIEIYRSQGRAIVFLDVPLLFEAGIDVICNDTWVVVSDENIRIKRVVERDGISEDAVKNRINSQMNDNRKIALAGYVLHNTGTKEDLYRNIDKLLMNYEKN